MEIQRPHTIFSHIGKKKNLRKTLKRGERFLGTGRITVEDTRISDNEQFTKCMYVSGNSINSYSEYTLVYICIYVCVKHYIYTRIYNIYNIYLKAISGYQSPLLAEGLASADC